MAHPYMSVTIEIIKMYSGSIRKKSVSLGRNLAGSLGGFLPGTIIEMWDPQRDFAFLRLPTAGVKSIVALSGYAQFDPFPESFTESYSTRTSPQVMVVTSEGIFYCYSLDSENGGECVLQKSYRSAPADGI